MHPGLLAALVAAAVVVAAGAVLVLRDGDEPAPWRYGQAMSQRRSYIAAAEVDGRIYAAGGMVGETGRPLATLQRYDPAGNAWTTLEPLHAFGALVFRGELWVIGGRRDQAIVRTVWILDPAGGRWRRGPAMPKPMELLGVAAAGDEIHAVWESTYQVYDAGTGRWSDGPRPLVARHALEAFTVGGTLYTVGGCTTQLRDSPVVERRRVSRARGASRSPSAGSRSSPRRSPGSSGRGRGARSRTRP